MVSRLKGLWFSKFLRAGNRGVRPRRRNQVEIPQMLGLCEAQQISRLCAKNTCETFLRGSSQTCARYAATARVIRCQLFRHYCTNDEALKFAMGPRRARD